MFGILRNVAKLSEINHERLKEAVYKEKKYLTTKDSAPTLTPKLQRRSRVFRG